MLGLIVVIPTVLRFSLEIEMEGVSPWRRARRTGDARGLIVQWTGVSITSVVRRRSRRESGGLTVVNDFRATGQRGSGGPGLQDVQLAGTVDRCPAGRDIQLPVDSP